MLTSASISEIFKVTSIQGWEKGMRNETCFPPIGISLYFPIIFFSRSWEALVSIDSIRQKEECIRKAQKQNVLFICPRAMGLHQVGKCPRNAQRNKVPKKDKNKKSIPMISKYLPSSSDSSCTDSGVEQLLSVFWLWLDGWSLVLRRLQSLADLWIKQGLKRFSHYQIEDSGLNSIK